MVNYYINTNIILQKLKQSRWWMHALEKWTHTINYSSTIWIIITRKCKQMVMNSTKLNLVLNNYCTCWLGSDSKGRHNQKTTWIHNSYLFICNPKLFQDNTTCLIVCNTWWRDSWTWYGDTCPKGLSFQYKNLFGRTTSGILFTTANQILAFSNSTCIIS